jgi:hypothetical protein
VVPPTSPGPTGTFTVTPAPIRTLRRIGGIAAAGGLTVALLTLLLARGGGGRSQAKPIAAPVPASSAPIVVPVAPVPPAEPAASAPDADAVASAKRRARLRRQHDRVARGLSIDPFAEAATRHQKP